MELKTKTTVIPALEELSQPTKFLILLAFGFACIWAYQNFSNSLPRELTIRELQKLGKELCHEKAMASFKEAGSYQCSSNAHWNAILTGTAYLAAYYAFHGMNPTRLDGIGKRGFIRMMKYHICRMKCSEGEKLKIWQKLQRLFPALRRVALNCDDAQDSIRHRPSLN